MAVKSQIGVRAVIISGNNIICVEHEEKGKRFKLFPGGGIEEGETIFEAAARETLEETKLIVTPERLIYTREIIAGKDHGVEFYILCSVEGGELSLGVDPEHEDGNAILKDVKEVSIVDFVSDKNWYPTELHETLEKDFKAGFSENRFLGTVKF